MIASLKIRENEHKKHVRRHMHTITFSTCTSTYKHIQSNNKHMHAKAHMQKHMPKHTQAHATHTSTCGK